MTNWDRAKKCSIDEEFHRLVDCLQHQGDINVIEDLVPLETKRGFIRDWLGGDEEEKEENEEVTL